MSEDQLKSPEFFEWFLHEHLKIKEHVSISWEELAEAEPDRGSRLFDPVIVAALRRVNAARKEGDEPSAEDLKTVNNELGYQNPLLKFVNAYNRYHDDSDEGHNWAEHVLTELTHAETLEDLQMFSVSDWHVCAKLLQGNIPVPRRIIGELLEKIITEGMQEKADIPALGITKPKRGRPSNPVERERYLTNLRYQFHVMTKKEGMTATKAYEMIAGKQNKDASTIRRDLERLTIERERKKKDIQARLTENKEEQARLLENFMEYQESNTRQSEKD